jgi:hypothetical protein
MRQPTPPLLPSSIASYPMPSQLGSQLVAHHVAAAAGGRQAVFDPDGGERCIGHDRLADDAMAPADQAAIQSRCQPVDIDRATGPIAPLHTLVAPLQPGV